MKFKRIIAAALSLSVIFGTSAVYGNDFNGRSLTVNAETDDSEYTKETYGNLTYYKYADHIEIYRCEQSASGELVIPETIEGLPVTGIRFIAFYGCTEITSVMIPDTVTSIADSAFAFCTNLTEIKLPNGITTIETDVFDKCFNLESVIMPDSVTSIGERAFADCFSLSSINLPDGITIIDKYAFEGCVSLPAITIPDSVTKIGAHAFQHCRSLSSVTVPSGVKFIESATFDGCTNLTEITFLNRGCLIWDGAISNFSGTIYGYTGSLAETFANRKGYRFVALDAEPAYGDANCDGEISMADAVLIMQAQSNPDQYGINGSKKGHITEHGMINGDCSNVGDGITGKDALAIQKYLLNLIDKLPE